MTMMLTDDERWAAVLRRDRALDGRFVTGVLTTGIYCRPSCAARHPARGNVPATPACRLPPTPAPCAPSARGQRWPVRTG